MATELSTSEGWRVIVENRPGALQTVGVAHVLKQSADGLSILAMTVPTLAAQALLPNQGLRLDTDLAPVIKIATGHNVLVVNHWDTIPDITEQLGARKVKFGYSEFDLLYIISLSETTTNLTTLHYCGR